jgi:hypothetical protein
MWTDFLHNQLLVSTSDDALAALKTITRTECPNICRLYIAAGHNFVGYHGMPPGLNPIVEVVEIDCVAGRGLRGDRFFDFKDNYKGQITFFALETCEAISQALGVRDRPSSVFRRNVITAGVVLNDLVGHEFQIQGVRFFGTEECRPCYWMDQAFAPGAADFLRGQGGLRAFILSDGILRTNVP